MSTQDWTLSDPPLTKIGVQQAKDLEVHLRQNVSVADRVGLIVASPFSRTIQTALHGLDWLIARGVPFKLDAYWQENSDNNCDTCASKEYLDQTYPDLLFEDIPVDYPAKTGPFAFTQEAIEARGRHVRHWLRQRPEEVIAIVSHSAFLRLGATKWRFANADYRIFDFQDGGDELVQWRDTQEHGGGMGRSDKGPTFARPQDFQSAFDPEKRSDNASAEGEIVQEIPKN